MILVVFDTNVVVSALLQPLGPSAQLFVRALNRSLQLCVSGSIFAEYEEVVSRPRFKLTAETIAGTLHSIRQAALWVRPTERVSVCSDPDDDIFLECAQSAKAEYIVTGNTKHFPKSWGACQVVTPRSLIEVFSTGSMK